jgi:hypothetical protein
LDEAWSHAIVNQKNNYKAKVLSRFNAYHSEIEVLNGEDISALVPANGTKIVLNDKTFVSLQLPEKRKAIFVELLAEGNYGDYRVFGIKINKAPSDAKLLNLENADQVAIINTLYFNNWEGLIIPFPSRKKNIEKKVPEKIN